MQIHSEYLSQWRCFFRMRPSVRPFMRVHIDFLYTVTEVKTSQSLPVCVQMVGSVTLFRLIRRCGPVSRICWLNCDRVSAAKPTHGGQTGTTPRQAARHTRHISWWMSPRGPHPLAPIIWRQMMRGHWSVRVAASDGVSVPDFVIYQAQNRRYWACTFVLPWRLEGGLKNMEFAARSHLKLVTCFDSIPSVSNVIQAQKRVWSFRGNV